jgi:hypothetical protein
VILPPARRAFHAARVLVASALLARAPAAMAHGFGQRFDLPLPLWLWLTGAGATIVVTFLLIAVFVRESHPLQRYPRFDLLRWPPARWVVNRGMAAFLRIVAALLFVVTLLAGLLGNPDPYSNLITTMVWVVWWVGVAFFCALIGDLWSVINPWSTLFAAAERAFAAMSGRRLSLALRYPGWLGAWPAVLVFLGFAWAELIWPEKNVPDRLAAVLLGYSICTWLGMFVFGREAWLRHAEAFTLAFGVLSRFAPLEFVERADGTPSLYLRPFGAGLVSERPVSWSFMVFVILMLATVTFDGFQETALMQRIDTFTQTSHVVASALFDLSELGLEESLVTHTLTLVAFVIAFVAIFWIVNGISLRGARARAGEARASTHFVACSFVLTLVPIAVAYHLSHYFSLLLTAGQFVIPLASDPFGWGWNLFGTAGYKVNLAIVSPYVFWYSAVAIIVLGHVVAVFLAHGVAVRLFGRQALVREVPMVVLMVGYTCLSLWILAQPIVG